jgi:hypothetical protein
MSNKGKQNIIQIPTFLCGAIQGLIGSETLLEKLCCTIGNVMVVCQRRPPGRELLPFKRIGIHDAQI